MKQDTKNRLDKLQRQERTKNIMRLICVFSVLSVVFSAIMIYRYSPGETTEVYGVVSGLSGKPVPRQGEILYLIVELENGKVVEVRKPDFVVFKKNERVQLKATKSSILGNVRYTFVNYQKIDKVASKFTCADAEGRSAQSSRWKHDKLIKRGNSNMYSRKALFILITILLLTVCSCSKTTKETGLALTVMREPSPIVSVNFDMLDAEEYNRVDENPFLDVLKNPLSTFSVDVDTASYSNVRRMIKQGKLPPKDAVRIEELINYFTYNYPEPNNAHPFSVTTEVSACPWNEKNKLVRIGLKGKTIPSDSSPASNLVFLLDVSGSMHSRLQLVKSALKLLVEQLGAQDRIAIVAYAGASGLVLPSTPGDQKAKIIEALDSLEAGGSTAGGAGITLAYKVALENKLVDGNNRIILATDGDFNVGPSSQSDLHRLIEEKRDQGVFLTVLGFGMGNLKDANMELLADKGNGNYAYIDSLLEAKKVLVNEMGATLLTIAKDVKIQVEFNPAKVKSYRLIGYENRLLRNEDFKDDTKDAGEIGAGHAVTAFYEIIPTSTESNGNKSSLKYTETTVKESAFKTNEIMTAKLRYKNPNEAESKLIVHPVIDKSVALANASEDFKFASAVAEFGLLLRDSKYKANASYDSVLTRAQAARGQDNEGYRSEFIQLVGAAKSIQN